MIFRIISGGQFIIDVYLTHFILTPCFWVNSLPLRTELQVVGVEISPMKWYNPQGPWYICRYVTTRHFQNGVFHCGSFSGVTVTMSVLSQWRSAIYLTEIEMHRRSQFVYNFMLSTGPWNKKEHCLTTSFNYISGIICHQRGLTHLWNLSKSRTHSQVSNNNVTFGWIV